MGAGHHAGAERAWLGTPSVNCLLCLRLEKVAGRRACAALSNVVSMLSQADVEVQQG